MPPTFQLTVVGSGTVAPSLSRVAPSHWVTCGDVKLLLDCGAGVLHRAAQLAIPWHEVTHIAITHFHVDHWGELAHVLFALKWGIEPSRSKPLTIIAPRGFMARMTTLASTFGEWVLEPGYPVSIEIINPGDVIKLDSKVKLEAAKTTHTDESLAYAVLFHGKRLVYTGDTGPSESLAEWASPCDALLCECSLPADRAIPIHLTPEQAGALATQSRAKRLILTHFYPPLEGTSPEVVAGQHYSGAVVAARDGDTFDLHVARTGADS